MLETFSKTYKLKLELIKMTSLVQTTNGHPLGVIIFAANSVPFFLNTFTRDDALGANAAATDQIEGYSIDYTQVPCAE